MAVQSCLVLCGFLPQGLHYSQKGDPQVFSTKLRPRLTGISLFVWCSLGCSVGVLVRAGGNGLYGRSSTSVGTGEDTATQSGMSSDALAGGQGRKALEFRRKSARLGRRVVNCMYRARRHRAGRQFTSRPRVPGPESEPSGSIGTSRPSALFSGVVWPRDQLQGPTAGFYCSISLHGPR